jgi:predicted 3-demethylubiquinone-9 3-methyltransferase (glyoxalase superfamily)
MKNNMQKITPNLWFNGNAEEAAGFYASIFPSTSIIATTHYPKSKEEGLADFQLNMAGKVLTVDFEIMGFRFIAINAGPEFIPNPSISFFVNFDPSMMENAQAKLNEVWSKLAEGGSVLMELGEYPFSKQYGWVQDKYGVSWQLIFTNPEGEDRPLIIPSLLFVKEKSGKAKEARDFYLSVFKDSKEGATALFEEDTPVGQKKGDVMFSDFMLENVWLAAMDGGGPHDFTFNEGVSLLIACQDQDKIDYYWEMLTADGGEESVCGWLKDKYGVSWQVVPMNMEELMKKPNAFKIMMQQKKIIIADY